MSTIHVVGGEKLEGSVVVQGSKNAALPILAATLMTEGVNEIKNCPKIADVEEMLGILRGLGCRVWTKEESLYIQSPKQLKDKIDKKHIISMRSSVVLLGILLRENGAVCMEYPGGCVIGARPVDMHIKGLEKLGCKFEHSEKMLCASVECLKGAIIFLDFPSVGATENLILAAVKAEGDTTIFGAAKEPEIVHLCEFINLCGGKISGAGTDCIHIEGVIRLKACSYTVPSDRIVAGTYLMCALATKGKVLLKNAPVSEMEEVLTVLKKMGAIIERKKNGLLADGDVKLCATSVKTDVYPGFPTDLQSLIVVLMTRAVGNSIVKENIYENRFHIVKELRKMNSTLCVKGNEVDIRGPEKLKGSLVRAKELRGNAALVMAGLMAEGETEILDSGFVKRGYENICRDLRSLGAIIYEKEE